MNLNTQEMAALFKAVFPRLENDRQVAILVDLPVCDDDDNADWASRRMIAYNWFVQLQKIQDDLKLEKIDLFLYENVRSNNADLPSKMYRWNCKPLPLFSDHNFEEEVSLSLLFSEYQVFFVLSEYSATAPMKIAAKSHGFRAATMAGFSEKMLEALRIDYEEVNERLLLLKNMLDKAQRVEINFAVGNEEYFVQFDLSTTKSHVSGGRFPQASMVGNLPSGETYIVPNENVTSCSQGILPVQFANEVVLYEIKNNKVVRVMGEGEFAQRELSHVKEEPAYGNIAELGFGILRDFGISPIGEVLLDEKLGFHIAFGRSDHFGGLVGPSDFSSPEKVVHIDYVYIPETQPQIRIAKMELVFAEDAEVIMVDNHYTLWEKK